MTPTIRTATVADAPAISRVFAASWKHFYKDIVPGAYLEELPENHWVSFVEMGLAEESADFLVAQLEQEIVGAAVFRRSVLEQYPDDSELVSLYLLPGREDTGIGHALLDHAFGVMRSRGESHCVLDVLEQNRRAIRFYHRHGFIETGHSQPVTLGGRELRCLILRKAL